MCCESEKCIVPGESLDESVSYRLESLTFIRSWNMDSCSLEFRESSDMIPSYSLPVVAEPE
jgi:hypothetical protein